MIETSTLLCTFRELYGTPARFFFAPGRVNLIGEHTDYNDGFVLPMAINRGTTVAAAARKDRRIRIHTLAYSESKEFDLDEPPEGGRGIWLDYVEGVARSLEAQRLTLRGADLLIHTDLPVGAGLSSSAALEISVGMALATISDAEVTPAALALAAHEAEQKYVGIQSGIMDQFISASAREGCALLLDCRSMESTFIPLDTVNYSVVICDSHVKRSLASSNYNTRQAECERGVQLLRQKLSGVRALRDVSLAAFKQHQGILTEPINKRCRHVVTENARTLAAAAALKAGNLKEFGKLMGRSHRSLRDDYEVSCPELDFLVKTAEAVDGVVGARMTGGGFGGCTVNLVHQSAVEIFREIISREYAKWSHTSATLYVAPASEGAREIVASQEMQIGKGQTPNP